MSLWYTCRKGFRILEWERKLVCLNYTAYTSMACGEALKVMHNPVWKLLECPLTKHIGLPLLYISIL